MRIRERKVPLIAISVLLIAASGSLFWVLGAERARAATTSGARIMWDTWGVPHIFARSQRAAFRAFGWAQMHNDGRLLLDLYAAAEGRVAEFGGEKYVSGDIEARLEGFSAVGRKYYLAQQPGFRAALDAFAQGIDEWARAHPGELDPAGRGILPVTGVDVMTAGVAAMYQFEAHLGPCARVHADFPGSNGWAIAPSHSANGHAMLLANPHLPWSGVFTWIEAQITAPGYSAYGATLVGMPVLGIAFNSHLGWTDTVNTIYPCTLYQLEPQGNGYLFDGRVRPFERSVDTLKIRQPDGSIQIRRLVIRHSVQGPLIGQHGKLFAMRIAGFQAGSFAGALQEWWDMGAAHNLHQFQAALRAMQLPMLNVIYADRAGNIMLFYAGLAPKLPKGDWQFWERRVPGDTSALVWNSVLPYQALPLVVNPQAGWVENSNSAPWYATEPMLNPARFPPYLAPPPTVRQGWASLREQRGIQMLTSESKISYARLITDKYSTHCELADRVLPDLLAAARGRGDALTRQAAGVLGSWDRSFDAQSRGAVLFLAWYGAMRKEGGVFAVPFDPRRLLQTPRGLKDPQGALEALEIAAKEVRAAFGTLDVPFGSVYRFERGKYNLPANGGPGDPLGVFRAVYYTGKTSREYTAVAGDSFIAAVEFSQPLKAKVLLTYGNSSDPRSRHFGDQLPLAARKQLRDALLTRDQIAPHLESCTMFSPEGSVQSLAPRACGAQEK